jgi:hypothetical protein
MMNAPAIALHEQRRFLLVAFHPYGTDVCDMLGLPSASLEVDETERRAATTPWYELMGQGPGDMRNRQVTTTQIITLARLYEAGAASLIMAEHPQYHRSLGEDLIAFFIALVSLGGPQ